MVYRLINHAGCWKNSSNVLPTPQVVYLASRPKKLVVYCFYRTREISISLLAQ